MNLFECIYVLIYRSRVAESLVTNVTLDLNHRNISYDKIFA